MANTDKTVDQSSASHHESTGTDAHKPRRVSADGGTADQTEPLRMSVRSGYDWLQSHNRTLHERIRHRDPFEVLLGCLFAVGVLGVGTGLTNVVPPAVLIPVGIGLLFVTYLLLAVLLLRALAEESDPPAYSWARQQRPPVKRRP